VISIKTPLALTLALSRGERGLPSPSGEVLGMRD